jgi:putative tricarboxylic transport membrane protein
VGAFELLTSGLSTFTSFHSIFFVVSGTILGIFFGVIPGLTATMGMAVFLPLTFGMSDLNGILFLIGMYVGACYAGSISAILVNIPGTPSAIATSFDGYAMAQRGEAGRAIGFSTISSALGGLFGVAILMFAAPVLAGFALDFGSQEYTGMALLGISIISYLSFGATIKGLIGGGIGLLLATVGQDIITGYPRFAFGSKNLQAGLEMIPVMVGFFGVTEVLSKVEKEGHLEKVTGKIMHVLPGFSRLLKMTPIMATSSIIGTFVGAIPAAGGAIASMAAYGIQKRFSRKSKQFGTGIPEGLVAAEASNNAAVGGAFVPMLSLGIPGDPQTAILIGALMINGLAPGPMLFLTRPDMISTIYLGNVFSVVTFTIVGLLCARFSLVWSWCRGIICSLPS